MSAWLLLGLFLLTVARARQAGCSWYVILSYCSCYFNFLIGGDIQETFSARTGRMVLEKHRPVAFWNLTCFVLDIIFVGFERNHCFASAQRKRDYDKDHYGRSRAL